jgi:hypothetical protein
MPRIMISYRRSDSPADAGRIADSLAQTYGRDAVFLDTGAIPPGTKFRDVIDGAIARADVVLAIVGPRWRARRRGGARIFDDDDSVRYEIEAAMRAGKIVVPLLVGGAQPLAPAEVPETMRAFVELQALRVDAGADYYAHLRRVTDFIDETFAVPAATRARAGSGRTPAARWAPAAAIAAAATAAVLAVVGGGIVTFGATAVYGSRVAWLLQLAAGVGLVVATAGIVMLASRLAGTRAWTFGARRIDTLHGGFIATAAGVAVFAFSLVTAVHFVAENFDAPLLGSPVFRQWVALLPPPQRGTIELAVAGRLRAEYGRITQAYGWRTEPEFAFARAMTAFLAALDGKNGYALYYDGQMNHAVNAGKSHVQLLHESVYQPWYDYLRNADSVAQVDGCYTSVQGYCRERTAWIRYNLAIVEYCASTEVPADAPDRTEHLQAAQKEIDLSIAGYPPFTAYKVSSTVLRSRIAATSDAVTRHRAAPPIPEKLCAVYAPGRSVTQR